MSNLFVDKISGKSGTSSGAPITLSGDTATLSSGVTGIPAAGITGTLGSGVTGGSGLTALGTVASGILGAGVSLKIHTATGSGDTSNQSNGYNFGPELNIASADNPNGAIFLVISGGGRMLWTGDMKSTHTTRHLEGGTAWTTTNGTDNTLIMSSSNYLSTTSYWLINPTTYCTYTNDSGGAVEVEFKMRLLSSSTSRWYANDTETQGGIIAIKVH